MSYSIEWMGQRHVSVAMAEPDTTIGHDCTSGTALVLSADSVVVIEGFTDTEHLAKWLQDLADEVRHGTMAIAEGDED